MTDNQSIGIMEGAFFVSKGEILSWANQLLKLNLTRVEQFGTGAVYCQILDVMHPGKIPMQRVNFRAINQWQFITNLKILQQGFARCKILKHIDIQKLAKSKYQDNLEFIQWMKRYFDLYNKSDISSYDPQMARKNAEVDFSYIQLRNPIKREMNNKSIRKQTQQPYIRGKSKSPYANVKSKINSRSITVNKPSKIGSNYYLQKLNEIRKVMKSQKSEDQLLKIQQILQEIQEQVPVDNTHEQIQNMKNVSTIASKKLISNSHKKIKTIAK